MRPHRKLGVRWTIGDVSTRGYEALRFSVWGAWQVFGPTASYVICVNSVPLEQARALTGPVPPAICWRPVTREEIPQFLRPHFDGGMSEGTGWKFAPVRVFDDCFELALDNDCILWEAPLAIRTWLDGEHDDHAVFAEDVRQCVGQFLEVCGNAPRNSGIRGLPPRFDYEKALQRVLDALPVQLTSEQDEQGLQAAALLREAPLVVVAVEEVTICSPFPPHRLHFGSCGAHFVGLNARVLPWKLNGREASEYVAEHWDRCRPQLQERLGC
jgi:hypothetical protein